MRNVSLLPEGKCLPPYCWLELITTFCSLCCVIWGFYSNPMILFALLNIYLSHSYH